MLPTETPSERWKSSTQVPVWQQTSFDQVKQDPVENVAKVNHTVVLWNENPEKLQRLHSQPEYNIGSHEVRRNYSSATPSQKLHCKEFFSLLGLSDFYPQRLTLHHALEIREDTIEDVKHLQDLSSSTSGEKKMKYALISGECTDPKLYPFLILQQIMAFHLNCRLQLIIGSKLYSSFSIKALSSVVKKKSKLVFHPMDGLLAVLHCADNFLRQDLLSRLATCQLAVPLLLPDPFEPHKLTFLVWALRSIIKEWQIADGTSKEGQLVSYPSPLVSFLRIGKPPKVSKSRIMNIVVQNSQHNTFFHYDCKGGDAKKILVNGLVEVCWYLPSNFGMVFPDVVTFANLHGDAQGCPKQVEFLSKVSFMSFVSMSRDNLNKDSLQVLKKLVAAPGGVVLLIDFLDDSEESLKDDDTWHHLLKPIENSVQIVTLNQNDLSLCGEVREKIEVKLKEKWNKTKNCSLDQYSDIAHLCGILVDEEEEHCQKGKESAIIFQKIIRKFRESHKTESLKTLLPLQGSNLWQEWASAKKEELRQTKRGHCEIAVYGQQQRSTMKKIRDKQLQHVKSLPPLMESFLSFLLTLDGKTRCYFLQWIHFFLDNLAREQLQPLLIQYKEKVAQLVKLQSNKVKNEIAEQACKIEIGRLNERLVGASFGLEHLLREVSQVYEAAPNHVLHEKLHISYLPQVAAQLMIEGYPLELMDGDAAHVPISWVNAVLSKVQELLSNPRLLILSVLGVQSSGKSTLLNTVFGVRFSTSAGRCTRGAFMQLLPIHSSLRQECKCDYFLIVDTEGLRAPELAELTLKHDNELATFAIGLANLTIINISGETVGDMDDILQTAVHAFIRMSEVSLKPSCHFVHQNVTAVMAQQKMMTGHSKFKDKLDKITQAAAQEEKAQHRYEYFTDVIDFDGAKHVFYFQNLWKGDPPMAPVNPGYSTNALFLKLRLIAYARHAQSSRLELFQKHLQELWKAILHENFVFSFKNTLEVTAYNTLEREYSQWSWSFIQQMTAWEESTSHRMKGSMQSELSTEYKERWDELPIQVQTVHKSLKEKMEAFFKNSPYQETIIKWKGETVTRLKSLVWQLQEHAQNHCNSLKTNLEARAAVDIMRHKNRARVINHLKLVLSQLQAEERKLNDRELEEKFEELWKECVATITSLPTHKRDIYVKGDVQKCLTSFELLTSAQSTVIARLQRTSLGGKGCALQLKVTKMHVQQQKRRQVSVGIQVRTGQIITDMILDHQRECIQLMKQKLYNPNLATELLLELFKDISQHSTEVIFTDDYRVDMAITVCGYAVTKFQEMVEKEEKDNDPVEYMEQTMKGYLLRIFKEEYNKIDREITAASMV